LTDGAGSGGALVVPQYVPGIQFPQRRLVVADLFAQGVTNTGMVTFMREKTFTNAAAAVAQGAAKPESALVFESATSKVEKVAHWLPVTEEMLEDVPQLQSYIDARLSLGVEIAEEDELLNGTGVSPHILGILLTPGLTASYPQPATGENNADTLAKQTLAVYGASFLMPDGYVLNPANWATTVLLKDGTNNYLVGNPFGASLVASSLWGLPVAVTPAIAAGTGLVGAFKTGAQVFRHGGIRVESSNSHQDYFVKNLVAIRAEERLALATYRPAAFGTVTALD
jgi:HK97 family phage major capsid protein